MKNRMAAKKSERRAPKVPAKAAAGKLLPVKKKLLAMREDLVKTVGNQQVGEVGQDTGDAADQASQSIEKEILFELSDVERTTLDQIEAALRKIDKGSYGLCESCQKPIAKPRLEALPFARYCIVCQSSSEKAPEAAEHSAGYSAVAEES